MNLFQRLLQDEGALAYRTTLAYTRSVAMAERLVTPLCETIGALFEPKAPGLSAVQRDLVSREVRTLQLFWLIRFLGETLPSVRDRDRAVRYLLRLYRQTYEIAGADIAGYRDSRSTAEELRIFVRRIGRVMLVPGCLSLLELETMMKGLRMAIAEELRRIMATSNAELENDTSVTPAAAYRFATIFSQAA